MARRFLCFASQALMRCSLNDASFADVKLTIHGPAGAGDEGGAALGRHIYCHRLILGLTCEYFRNMFLGAFAESDLKDRPVSPIAPLPSTTQNCGVRSF